MSLLGSTKSKKMDDAIAKATLFEPSLDGGLTAEQVESRHRDDLVNKSKKVVTKSYTEIFLSNILSPLNVILFGVFILMLTAKLGFINYFFIGILAINITIGIIQDIHARHLVMKLRVVSDPKAHVIRDGKESEIPSNEIVLEDILVLRTGDQICADSVLMEGTCMVDESLLTGESVSVKKEPGDLLYSGTFLTKGNVKAKAVKIGASNYSELIRDKAGTFTRPKSEIKQSIGLITLVCSIVSLSYGLIVSIGFIVKQNFTTESYVEFVKSTSGAMVAMIPAGMILLTSCALAVGVIQLSKRKMIVQQLYCIEMLARVDVLCLDKTGTLTDGTMNVANVLCFNKVNEEKLKHVIASVVNYTKDANATASALRIYFGEEDSEHVVSILPFDSASKFSAIETDEGIVYSIGAYGFAPGAEDNDILIAINKMASNGLRCVVVTEGKGHIDEDGHVKKQGKIIGVIGLSDHVKDDAKETLEWFAHNDVAIRVISGDSPATVSFIAKEAGVVGAEKYISLEGMSLEEVANIADKYVVFGRVSPEQKATLITAYKNLGHKVAMTGDGVNDILALKVADCSIAMASGSDAAKSVSHLVSLNNTFSSLPDVVAQGRRVINNLSRTCSLFLSKTFFAIILSTIFLVNAWAGGKRYPFTTTSLFVWETISIGLAAFFLALQPSNERLSTSFASKTLGRAIPAGICEVVAAGIPFIIVMNWPNVLAFNPENFNLNWEVATTISVLIFTQVSFIVLFRVCYPLDRYRAVVFFSCLALGIALFLIDYFSGKPLQLKWGNLNLWSMLVCVASIIVIALLYFVLDKFYRYITGTVFREERVINENKNQQNS